MEKSDKTLVFRPRFRLELAESPEVVKQKIETSFDSAGTIIKGKIVKDYIVLIIPDNEQHYWSPQLSLEIEPTNDGSRIRGLYGPKPGVWTMFVFIYSLIGFLTMLGLIFGFSQLMLKMEPYGLWIVPVGVGLMAGLFVISKIGQRLGMEQMHQLKDFLDEALQK